MFVGPAQPAVAVLERARVRRLRREPVVDGHADASELRAQFVEQQVVDGVAADHVAAAVHPVDARQRTFGIHRPVHAQRHIGIAGDDVVGPVDGIGERQRAAHEAAQRRQDLGRQVVERDVLDRRGDFGIEQITRSHGSRNYFLLSSTANSFFDSSQLKK